MNKFIAVALLLIAFAAPSTAQTCRDVNEQTDRHAGALLLAQCLGDPDPKVRDELAFARLSSQMRANELEPRTLAALKTILLATVRDAGNPAIVTSFSALTLSEVARTDRLKPWMTGVERQEMVDAASMFLIGIQDYRAFSDRDGFVHAVAHGADFTLQLALNPAVSKPQLDQLLKAIATQIAPKNPDVAYWAGEPDRLARAVVVIAQRKLLSDDEWEKWFAALMNPAPLASWDVAFNSEIGIRRHHNARAFLLSVFASVSTSEDLGLKQLVAPTREALKLVP